jgi:hypothetical protein
MTLKGLFLKNNWKEVERKLNILLPEDELSFIPLYKKLFFKIRNTRPALFNRNKMTIHVDWMEEDSLNQEGFYAVSASTGELYKEMPDFKYLGEKAQNECANEQVRYSCFLTPLKHLVYKFISQETLENLNQIDIIIHIMNEISFVGFSEKARKNKIKDLKKKVKEIKKYNNNYS